MCQGCGSAGVDVREVGFGEVAVAQGAIDAYGTVASAVSCDDESVVGFWVVGTCS